MAIDAGGSFAVAALHGLTVEAAIVGGLLVGVAGGASNFLGNRFVRRAFYVGVAVNAGKHAAVDRILESLRIDVEADGLAVFLMRQRSVAMANEAFVGAWFGRLFTGSVECARR